MSVKARMAFSWYFLIAFFVMVGAMLYALPPILTNWLTTWMGPPWNWVCGWLLMVPILIPFTLIFLAIIWITGRKGKSP